MTVEQPVQTLAQERVELTLPAGADLMSLARYAVATVATRAGFGIDEIEDLRLAVDELCISLGPLPPDAVLEFEFERRDDLVSVVVSAGNAGSDFDSDLVRTTNDLSEQLLRTLVDEHGHLSNGRPSAWLRRRRHGGQRWPH
jgi:hypothetical protein